jgi:hypothetical protein
MTVLKFSPRQCLFHDNYKIFIQAVPALYLNFFLSYHIAVSRGSLFAPAEKFALADGIFWSQ